jgi:hypothetical protein
LVKDTLLATQAAPQHHRGGCAGRRYIDGGLMSKCVLKDLVDMTKVGEIFQNLIQTIGFASLKNLVVFARFDDAVTFRLLDHR